MPRGVFSNVISMPVSILLLCGFNIQVACDFCTRNQTEVAVLKQTVAYNKRFSTML
jgi:hypothetical protein